jgi:hypothetical protein
VAKDPARRIAALTDSVDPLLSLNLFHNPEIVTAAEWTCVFVVVHFRGAPSTTIRCVVRKEKPRPTEDVKPRLPASRLEKGRGAEPSQSPNEGR